MGMDFSQKLVWNGERKAASRTMSKSELEKIRNKAKEVNLALTTDDGKSIGKVSQNAYNAIRRNALGSYTPVNDEEKKTLDSYTQHLKDKYGVTITEPPRKANLKDLTVNSFQQGFLNNRLGEENYKKMYGNSNSADEIKGELSSDKYNYEAHGKLANAVSGAAQFLGQQLHQLSDEKTLGAVTGTTAATLIAGNAGPQALVPEEIITVPAAIGLSIAMGSAMVGFEVEAGNAYDEMLENGVSEEVARNVALGVGGVNAALEGIQVADLLKSFKILKADDLTQPFAKKLAKVLIDRGINVASETGQELAQETSTILGVQAATKADTGEWAYSANEVADRLKETAVSSALSFGLMGVAGDVPGTVIPAASRQRKLARIGKLNNAVDVINKGLSYDKSSEAYKNALKLQKQNGKRSDAAIGYQAVLNSAMDSVDFADKIKNSMKTAKAQSAEIQSVRDTTAQQAPVATATDNATQSADYNTVLEQKKDRAISDSAKFASETIANVTKNTADYSKLYQATADFVDKPVPVIDRSTVKQYADIFASSIKDDSIIAQTARENGVDISDMIVNYVVDGIAPEVDNASAAKFMMATRKFNDVFARAMVRNLGAYQTARGNNATLAAQVDAISNGDYSFMRNAPGVANISNGGIMLNNNIDIGVNNSESGKESSQGLYATSNGAATLSGDDTRHSGMSFSAESEGMGNRNNSGYDSRKDGLSANNSRGNEILKRRAGENTVNDSRRALRRIENKTIEEILDTNSFLNLKNFVGNEISINIQIELLEKYRDDKRVNDDVYDFSEVVVYDMLTDESNPLRELFADEIAEYFLGDNISEDTDITGAKVSDYILNATRDSIVRNYRGLLIPVYHSTDSEFDIFVPGDIGIHFGSFAQAKQRATDKGYANPKYIKAYLNITKPLYIDEDFIGWNAYQISEKLAEMGIITVSEANEFLQRGKTAENNKMLVDLLISEGYDGIIYANDQEALNGKSYIVFNDSQVFRINGAESNKDNVSTQSTKERMAQKSDNTASDSTFIDDRTADEVGDRQVKAFQFEHPEFKPFYKEIAQELLGDLSNTQKGERYTVDDYDREWVGVKRMTSEGIARIKDDFNVTYSDIEKALRRLIEDNGMENVALAKRIELVIDDMLTDGYKTFYGDDVPPNAEYIALKEKIGDRKYDTEKGDFDGELPVDSANNGGNENVNKRYVPGRDNIPSGDRGWRDSEPASELAEGLPRGTGQNQRIEGERGISTQGLTGRSDVRPGSETDIRGDGQRITGSPKRIITEQGTVEYKEVPAESLENKDEVAAVIAENERKGLKTVFYKGWAFVDGKTKIRGFFYDDTVYIMCDHPEYSITQINDHEFVHKAAGTAAFEKLKGTVKSKLSAQELAAVRSSTLRNYGSTLRRYMSSVMRNNPNMSIREIDALGAEYLYEEIVANLNGNMGNMQEYADRFAEDVAEFRSAFDTDTKTEVEAEVQSESKANDKPGEYVQIADKGKNNVNERQFTNKISDSIPDDVDVSDKNTQVGEKYIGIATKSENYIDGFDNIQKLFENVSHGENVTVAELKQAYRYIVDEEAEIKTELSKLKNDELNKKLSYMDRGRYTKKADMVDAIYEDMLEDVYYAVSGKDTLTTSFFGFGSNETQAQQVKHQIDEAFENLTDEKLSSILTEKKKKYDAVLEKRAEMKRSFENPETLADFERKKRVTKLTEEEQERYDRLYADEKRKKRTRSKETTKNDKSAVANEFLSDADKFTVEKTVHTKTGEEVWVVKPKERLDTEVWKQINSSMKSLGGSYWRGNGGWNFKTNPFESAANTKIEDAATDVPAKIRSIADGMQAGIDEKFKDRLTNTAKRAREAASATEDGERMQKVQQTLRNIADAIERGTTEFVTHIDSKTQIDTLNLLLNRAKRERISQTMKDKSYDEKRTEMQKAPTNDDVRYLEMPLSKLYVDTVSEFAKAARGKEGYKLIAARLDKAIKTANNNYVSLTPSLIEDIDKVVKNLNPIRSDMWNDSKLEVGRLKRLGIESIEELRAYMREYITYLPGIDERAQRQKSIQQKEIALTNSKIEGFFPTPKNIVSRMLDEADIQSGDKVLEPSAGKGNIADEIKSNYPNNSLDVVEWNGSLAELLTEKGHNLVGNDFLETNGKYDKIVMNPPFEKGQDIDHVLHAYNLLNNGGRVVAIMSEGPFFRTDKKSTEFREWLDEVGGTSEKLPEGSFKNSERSTGVNTRLVVIDKSGEVKFSAEEKDKRKILEAEFGKKSFAQQVDETLETVTSDGNHVYVGKTTSILKQIGLADLPLLITKGHLRDMHHEKIEGVDKYHGLSSDIIKKIPYMLDYPAMVFDSLTSKNAVCLLSNVRDDDGLPILIVVKPNGTGKFNDVQVHSNFVLSAYGKNNPQELLNQLNIKTDNVLYINKTKTQDLLKGARLQLPARLSKLRFDTIIHKSNAVVNKNGIRFSAEETNDAYEIEGLADFMQMFDAFDNYIATYGLIKPGENPARDVQVPKKTTDKKYVSKFARTMMEAGVTPDDSVDYFRHAIVEGRMSHMQVGDKAAKKYARDKIDELGFDGAMERWNSIADMRGIADKYEIVFGMELYNQCINAKDVENAMRIAVDLTHIATKAGQAVQSFRVLKTMSPDGQLYCLEKSIQTLNRELQDTLKDKANEIKIDEQLAKDYLTAKTTEDKEAALDYLLQDVADQIQATRLDKWNAWRYLSMLGNPRTHFRNIVGNAIFYPVRKLKNAIGAILERRIPIEERTKSLTRDGDALAFAKEYAEKVKDDIKGNNGKYDIGYNGINEKRTIFKTRALEWLRKKNIEWLDTEDWWFLRPAYVDSLAQIMTARGITAEFLNSGTKEAATTLERLHEYAMLEAQKATYRDANALANVLNEMRNRAMKKGGIGKVAWITVGDGVMPFRNTPLNIAKRAIEYSPVSIIKACTVDVRKLQTDENFTAADLIDDIAKGMIGSVLVLFGMFLSHMGLINGGDDENEKKRKFDETTGWQGYSLNIGDYTYTIDWAAPSVLPLFVGVELMNSFKKDGITFKDAVGVCAKVLDPMLELSCLQSLSSLIETAGYSQTGALSALATDAVTSYISQAYPTIFGQVARTIDGTRRSTYIDKNSDLPVALDRFIQSMEAKVPFMSKSMEPRLDAWGREMSYGDNPLLRAVGNFVSPGYAREKDTTRVTNVLNKLYEKTKDSVVYPVVQGKTVTIDKVTHDLSASQYTWMAKKRGKLSLEMVKDLIYTSEFDNATDEEKLKMLKKCYDNAYKQAKSEFAERYGLE